MRILAILLMIAGTAGAACIPIENDRITAGNLALGVPELQSVKPDTAFGYAPQPGAVRLISAGEIRRFAAAQGVTMAEAAEVCVEYPVRPLDPAELVRAMKLALAGEVRIELVDYSRIGVPRGTIVFERAGLLLPADTAAEPLHWRGHVEYGLKRRAMIWARVRATETRTEIVAGRDLRPGESIAEGDIRLDTREVPISRRASVGSAAAAVGMLPRRSIPTGTAIRAEWLQAPEVVRRGDQVPLVVVSASAVLRLHARAESSARAGQRVTLTNPDNGKRFEAVIDRNGEGLVQVRGGAR